AKPFSIREVMLRVKAVLKRTQKQAIEKEDKGETLFFEGLEMNLERKTVRLDGEETGFTKTEFELLLLLFKSRGRVFSRQELIDKAWPKDVLVSDRTVDVYITRVRKKIGRFAKCIVTRQGFGYYFDA
ncbi:MAG: response regulator transcription factor, partial [Prevotella sp.]|nr:response regulator transcription factor [Prevotellaceae bacterium]MDY3935348.1 response regulator transcription factor [Prevotella sp.]